MEVRAGELFGKLGSANNNGIGPKKGVLRKECY